MTTTAPLVAHRMRPADLARLSAVGMRTRKLRAALSALGIAIGVAAIVAVLGLSSSSQAGLLNEISRLGTNLLTVANGQTLSGDTAELPVAAPGMISRIGPVTAVDDTGRGRQRHRLPQPADPLDQHQRPVRAGHQPGSAQHRRHLGGPGTVPERRHRPRAGRRARRRRRRADGHRPHLLRRADLGRAGNGSPSSASSIPPCSPPRSTPPCSSDSPPRRSTSASTATPPRSTCARTPTRSTPSTTSSPPPPTPNTPTKSPSRQPSDALVAQAEAKGALNSLFLGLGAVSLLVGAIGVGNVMLIGVLERRSEIGLRRALGATKGHIRIQFLTEAMLLALLGGAVGVGLGAAATAVYAHTQHWATVIPPLAWAGGLGLRPAHRRHRRAPARHRAPPACHPPKRSGQCDRATRLDARQRDERSGQRVRTRPIVSREPPGL